MSDTMTGEHRDAWAAVSKVIAILAELPPHTVTRVIMTVTAFYGMIRPKNE